MYVPTKELRLTPLFSHGISLRVGGVLWCSTTQQILGDYEEWLETPIYFAKGKKYSAKTLLAVASQELGGAHLSPVITEWLDFLRKQKLGTKDLLTQFLLDTAFTTMGLGYHLLDVFEKQTGTRA